MNHRFSQSRIRNSLMILATFSLLLSTAGLGLSQKQLVGVAQAQSDPTPTSADSTSSLWQGGEVTTYASSPQTITTVTANSTEDILLIQTSDPWEKSTFYVGNNWYDGVTADTIVLNTLGYSYRIATWNDINTGAVNIFSYPVVLIVNDQVQAFYNDYAAHVTDFENYVATGHTLLFFAAGYGWAGGVLNASLPGGVSWNLAGLSDVAAYNTIINPSHPIISAQLSNHSPLTNADLYSNYCSHGWFSNLPGGTNILLRESASEGGNPTLIDYRIGNGRVIASTLTWEHNWAYHIGGDGYGTFARKALDDVFLYALSGGAVPTNVKITLGIEDAPNWTEVNKSKGSYVDVVAHVSGEAAYQANVVLQVPSDKLGAPVKTFTRNRPDNSGYGQENQYTNLGSGQYQISTNLQQLSDRFYKEIVWRFTVPNNATPEQDLNLSVTVSIPGHTVQSPTSNAKLNIIDYARSLIVTNRKLLFSKYEPNPADNQVTSLLEEVYKQASLYNGEVFYVDLYNDAARDWSQNVDYSNENAVNTVATAIDGLIDGWYNRLTKHPHWWEALKPEFLLIVGGDETIPFYRAKDDPYQLLGCGALRITDCEKNISLAGFPANDPVLTSYTHNYFFSDNIYADVGGNKDQWETGKLELAAGRIVGEKAEDMQKFIMNASLKTLPLTDAVVASFSHANGSSLKTVLQKLQSKAVNLYGDSQPDLTDNANWTSEQWRTALEQPYQLLAYQGHGHFTGWYGPTFPSNPSWGGVTVSTQPAGHIADNKPLITAMACQFAIPVKNGITYKLVAQGVGGIYGSTGLSASGNDGSQLYGVKLHNEYFKYLINTSNQYSEYFGTALLKAKLNHSPALWLAWAPYDRKTVMEYVYYGLPWSFMRTPNNQQSQVVVLGPEAVMSRPILVSVPEVVDQASVGVILTATVSSYQFVPVGSFEVLEIPEAESINDFQKPVLPVIYKTFILPPGSSITGLSLVSEQASSLGQHNIPAANLPVTPYSSYSGYTSTMSVTGVYPPLPRFNYESRDLGDQVEVRVAIAPATFDVNTHEVTLYTSTALQLNYTTTVPVAISQLSLDKPEYTVGSTLTPTAQIDNVSADPITLTARVNVYDAFGTLSATTASAPFSVLPGSSQNLQVPWNPTLEPGSYRLTLSVEENGTTLASTSSAFNMLAARVITFDIPEKVRWGEYGMFSVTLANYQPTSATAVARIYVYNTFGVETASLLQRTFVIAPNSSGTTSWLWDPTGLPEGVYTLRAVVQVGDEIYTSDQKTMNVSAPLKVYLPVVSRNYSSNASGFNSQFNSSADGWEPHGGTWSIASNAWYTTLGLANAWASTSYAANFTNFDYQVRLWRYGCDCSNYLAIRGVPNPLSSDKSWYSHYIFIYTRGGSYSVWKRVAGGSYIALQNWTTSSAINKGDAWNTLRVVANSSNLYFYINGILVWTGSDSSLTSGRVGIGMFRDSTSTGNQLYVDWATLSTLGISGLDAMRYTVSPEQQTLNDEANQNRNIGSIAQPPP